MERGRVGIENTNIVCRCGTSITREQTMAPTDFIRNIADVDSLKCSVEMNFILPPLVTSLNLLCKMASIIHTYM
jgi:hypothetical protein